MDAPAFPCILIQQDPRKALSAAHLRIAQVLDENDLVLIGKPDRIAQFFSDMTITMEVPNGH